MLTAESAIRTGIKCSGYQYDDGYPEQFKNPRAHPSDYAYQKKKPPHFCGGLCGRRLVLIANPFPFFGFYVLQWNEQGKIQSAVQDAITDELDSRFAFLYRVVVIGFVFITNIELFFITSHYGHLNETPTVRVHPNFNPKPCGRSVGISNFHND